jgi:hypothetical protein
VHELASRVRASRDAAEAHRETGEVRRSGRVAGGTYGAGGCETALAGTEAVTT